MLRTVTVGLDASPESRAAAEWAAREAGQRGLVLKIVHVREPAPAHVAQAPPVGAEPRATWAEELQQESAEGLRLRHPGVEMITELLTGGPRELLTQEADAAELLALGSRGLGGFGGFLLGSVGLHVAAHARRPVVLVRAGEQAADEHLTDPAGMPSAAAPFRPVVLGLDIEEPDEALLGFAFDNAARRAARLRVVHGWSLPPTYEYGAAVGYDPRDTFGRHMAAELAEVLRPWRQKFPDVEVVEASRYGSAASTLLQAARDASLVVVGRRIRTGGLGAHIGHVTHAVLHHSTAPVAVVAHG
ncbi:universal stress protein [Streptomyces humi]|uniref:universal stress protein n=1 Tax=Streptomyces humi TaxID=1428620 RepID=UPI0006287778|nr:universal stress protein [Streptomyces humi]